MKTSKLFLFIIATAALTFSGCKKNKENNTDKLTNKDWKITSKIAYPGIDLGAGDFIYNVFNFVPSCSKDDLTKFLDDHTANFDEGATKCNVSDPQTTSGTWSFNSDETQLTVMKGAEVTSYTLLNLTDDSLTAKYTDAHLTQGITQIVTVTFIKQ